MSPHELSWPTRLLAITAGTKALVAMLAATPLAPAIADSSGLATQTVLANLPWLVPALVLLLANGRQFRTGSLGVAMLLVASGSTAAVTQLMVGGAPFVEPLLYVVPSVFAPYFVGRFLLEFPQPRTGRSARWLVTATRVAGGIGCVRFAAALASPLLDGLHQPFLYQLISGGVDPRVGPFLNSALFLLVLGFSFIGFRGLLAEDRRRHERLFLGWAILIATLAARLMKSLYVDSDGNSLGVPYTPLRTLLGILTIAWAVAPSLIAYRALEGRHWQLREVVRRGVRVLLSPQLLAAAAIVPLTATALVIYIRQDQIVSEVFSSTTLAWMVVAALSAVTLYSRRRLLHAFNRAFFREHYDAGETLFTVTNGMRQSRGIDEMVAHLTSGIDRALRPYRVVVLVRDESATQFVPLFGSAEPLPASALLIDLLTVGRGVLDTPLAGGTSPMRWLPQDERYWLVDCGARLVVPLHGSDGTLNGLIAVGDRKSGRTYSDDDRLWLSALAESASLTIEAHSSPAPAEAGPGAASTSWRVGLVQRHARALECDACGHIDEASAAVCDRCGSPLVPSLVPHLLFGKFRFEQRIGRGGMGVVYRARDLALERPVAVKLLPSATPEYSELLRLEARAMAAVTHRHLAVVYGVEAWRGQPLLVCEYMAHGTLADQLSKGPMATGDVLALGLALAEALAVVHARHLLHRDIKPSNIGFDHTGVPKLLDFGLAHLWSATTSLPEELRPNVPAAGTPLYMSPEAVAGAAPTPSVDLWSLHVLLYEAITGRHPFRRETTAQTLSAIANDPAPPLTAVATLSADRAIRLASYFAGALSKRADARPASAADVAAALRALMA